MVLHVQTSSRGNYCGVDLADGCSPLTSQQVKYVLEKFNLLKCEERFDFVFQLYNFVFLANTGNCTLCESHKQTTKLHVDVVQMSLLSLTAVIKKCKRNDSGAGAGSGLPKKLKTANAPSESDVLSKPDENEIVSNVALMEELKRARCTIQPEVNGFRTLLPVCVFFPCKGQQLPLALS